MFKVKKKKGGGRKDSESVTVSGEEYRKKGGKGKEWEVLGGSSSSYKVRKNYSKRNKESRNQGQKY